jgi:hypothetical protein
MVSLLLKEKNMKYQSPKYELCSMQVNDVITLSYQANNCTVATNQAGTIDPESTVTQVSGFFNKLQR